MPTILALDVSVVACGWAFGPVVARPVSGVIRFAPPGVSDDSVWFGALRWMTEQMTVLKPDVVAIEAAIMASAPGQGGKTNPHTQGLLWGLQAILRTVVKAKSGRPALMVNVSTARKFFTGKGNYPKGEAKPAIKRRCIELGWVDGAATHDTTDALCVWAFGASQIDPAFAAEFTPLGMSKPRRKALADVEL